MLLVEWSGDSPQIGMNAHRRVVVDHKLPRDPATDEPVGMVTESNGCSDACGGPFVHCLLRPALSPQMPLIAFVRDVLCCVVRTPVTGPDSWKVFNLTTQLWHLKALQKTGVEGLWMDASWFKVRSFTRSTRSLLYAE